MLCGRAQLPGRFYELNIHYGVFVGGMGDFNEIFLGNQKNFRGCIENVFFNGLDVMVKAEDQATAIGDAKVRDPALGLSPVIYILRARTIEAEKHL